MIFILTLIGENDPLIMMPEFRSVWDGSLWILIFEVFLFWLNLHFVIAEESESFF
jgi:hypothetical protein